MGIPFAMDMRKWFIGAIDQGWAICPPDHFHAACKGGPRARSALLIVDTFAEAATLVAYANDFGPDMLGFALIGLRERGLVR